MIQLIKVVKIPLIYAEERNQEDLDYKKVNEILWQLQRQTRSIIPIHCEMGGTIIAFVFNVATRIINNRL